MGNILDSIVVKFGGSVTDAITTKVDYDDQRNGNDENGSPKSTFYPEDKQCYLIVQVPTGYYVDKLQTTSGDATNDGFTTRTVTDKEKFLPEDENENLNWTSRNNSVSPKFYGRSSPLVVSGKLIRATSPPVIGDFSYSINVFALTLYFPNGAVVNEDNSWPQGLVIWVEKS